MRWTETRCQADRKSVGADAALFSAGWQARAITGIIVRILLVAIGLWLSA